MSHLVSPYWLVCVALFGGCHARGWQVSTPKRIESIPTDSFAAFSVIAHTGGVKPIALDATAVRCVDPAICEARVVLGDVRVIGRQVGSTSVVVDAYNPIYSENVRRTIEVVITAPPTRTAIALGAPLPVGGDFVHRVADVDVGHCMLRPGYFESSVFGGERADVHVYTCSPYVEIDHERRFQSCVDGPCSADDYLLCARVEDGVVASTAMMTRAPAGFAIASTEGPPLPQVCTPRN